MGNDKYFREDPDSQYHKGVLLNERKIGEWEIVSAKKGKDGKVYMEWCFPRDKDGKPSKKFIPQKASLGNKERAISILEHYLNLLKEPEQNQAESEAMAHLKSPAHPDDDEVPF